MQFSYKLLFSMPQGVRWICKKCLRWNRKRLHSTMNNLVMVFYVSVVELESSYLFSFLVTFSFSSSSSSFYFTLSFICISHHHSLINAHFYEQPPKWKQKKKQSQQQQQWMCYMQPPLSLLRINFKLAIKTVENVINLPLYLSHTTLSLFFFFTFHFNHSHRNKLP